jgi:hypothetical protein
MARLLEKKFGQAAMGRARQFLIEKNEKLCVQ